MLKKLKNKLLIVHTSFQKAQLVVETTNGVVSGAQNETVTGTVYYSFRGIPYAQPPLGVLRFAVSL